ncbi:MULTISPECIES: carbon-nitrogen hydrolase family protein [Streptomycetaceae]|uniref:Putative hydrolase n=1 Tax=Streptantibioticus cattleyicolor (strain ATCC 35852 / DSM 46488 / JCM 4925 / NBRC 14057 / NRRL 8057) TaxID=1003195 RepID=F8K508_STREN|nr:MULTISPECIES: carbon-nitrogen hydrolase family protein [Streptomycetaceae]AEW97733.1 putative hydrolase [Streptantibioticus cattleyicolor NRRL 8057 = DSM 46488]MYS62156.1 carbon-nitrogen hydrolase [Streptomyces sp. SID5468]CCB78051.1 putative enzyme [Streptantibioticus cattleyicolor NRRL 8057 = DSM 46488]
MTPLRIALHQGPAGVPGTPDESLAALDDAVRRAAAGGADLLVTGEMYLTGYAVGDALPRLAEAADGPSAARVAKIAADHGVAVVYGYPERDGGRVYNSAQLIGADGSALANYRKTHLFGDFEMAGFTPGDTPVVQARLGDLTVGLLICYDVEFPENVRAHAVAGTDLLAVPTALMRPYEFVPHTLVPARAYESQLFVAYTNRCGAEGEFHFAGLSCLAGPDGVVRARAGTGAELVLADADPALLAAARAETPYLRDRRPGLYTALTRPVAG